MNTYGAIASAVNRRHHVRPSRQDLALQAFVGAVLLSERQLGVDTLTTAARLVGVSRFTVSAALALHKSQNADLVARVLCGRESLHRAANEVRLEAHMARELVAFLADAKPRAEPQIDIVNAAVN
jgi:hypothetical protein